MWLCPPDARHKYLLLEFQKEMHQDPSGADGTREGGRERGRERGTERGREREHMYVCVMRYLNVALGVWASMLSRRRS